MQQALPYKICTEIKEFCSSFVDRQLLTFDFYFPHIHPMDFTVFDYLLTADGI
jgi:hypothetical protein